MLPKDIMDVCRLCLMKEHVNICIFENESKEIYYKISACLPVTISVEDKLPKKICLNCFNKVNLFYDFWNQTLDTEKHLLSWLNAESENYSNFNKNSQTYSYTISESNDDSIDDHNIGESDDNHNESDPEGNKNAIHKEQIKDHENSTAIKTNQILNVDYRDDKPGPSGFQEDQSNALKQLQGLGEELMYLYVESEESEQTELLSPIENYYNQNSPQQCNLSFSSDLNRPTVEIEESNDSNHAKSNVEQTSTYSVEFPKSNQPTDKSKFTRKRIMKVDKLGTISYACPSCDASFLDKVEYHRHELIHYVDYPYECALCGKQFKRFKQLEHHKTYYHMEDWFEDDDRIEGELDCVEAEKSHQQGSDTQSIKKAILGSPSNNRKKHCEVCGKIFSNEITCKIHGRKHDNEDAYVCESCGQQFSASENHKCSKPREI